MQTIYRKENEHLRQALFENDNDDMFVDMQDWILDGHVLAYRNVIFYPDVLNGESTLITQTWFRNETYMKSGVNVMLIILYNKSNGALTFE